MRVRVLRLKKMADYIRHDARHQTRSSILFVGGLAESSG